MKMRTQMTAFGLVPSSATQTIRLSLIDMYKGVKSEDCKCVSQRLLLSNSPYAK